MKVKMRNIALIVVSVLIAVVLWLLVITEREYEADIYVPLVITDIPQKYMIASKVPTIVHIQVRARGKDLLAEMLTSGKAEISLSNFSYGRKTIALSADYFELYSQDIRLVEIVSPKEVIIDLDRKDTRKVPVYSKLVIVPADGMICSVEPEFEPAEVTLDGPESKLKKISEVYTVAETLRGFNTSTSVLVPLVSPDDFVNAIPDTVAVLLEIEPLAQRRIDNIDIKLVDSQRGQGTIEPNKIAVIITGASSDVDIVNKSQIKAFIAYKDSISPATKIKPTVTVPPDVQVIGTDPEYIKFTPGGR